MIAKGKTKNQPRRKFEALHAQVKAPEQSVAEHKQAEEKIRSQIQRLAVMREISLAITSSLDLHTVLETLLQQIDHLLPYPAATLRLFNRETEKLEPATCRNLDMEDWKAGTGVGFEREIIARRAPLISIDVQSDPRAPDPNFFRKNGLVSFLAIPLIVKDQLIGVLSLYTKKKHQFTTEEIEFLSTLGGQAAIAIHNSQLYEQTKSQEVENAELMRAHQQKTIQLREANQQLSALHIVASTASKSLELNSVFREVIQKITEIFNFDATRIYLFDPQTEKLHLRASFETKPELFAQVQDFQRGQGNVGRVAETGEPMIFENIQNNPHYQKLSHTKNTQRVGFSFFAVFPIKAKQRTLGTIICIGQKPRRLTHGEIQLITSMAEQIGIAVENAQLFEKTKMQATRLEELAKRMQVAREEERSRLAREVHDELGQALTVLKMELAGQWGHLSQDPNLLDEGTKRAYDLIDLMVETVRRIGKTLRPGVLDDLGLGAAIEWQVREFENRTGLSCQIAGLNNIVLDKDRSIAVFRIFQEILTNISRHAEANKVNIEAEKESGNFLLVVTDNGKGIQREQLISFESFGIIGMKERALLCGGKVHIRGIPGKGTTVTVEIPIREV